MIKTRNNHEDITYLNSYISKVLKRNFGKGPATCFTSLTNDKMFIYMKHFITPAEEVLFKKNELHLAYKTRSVVFESIFDEIKDEIKKVLGIVFTSIQHDWDFYNNTGILLLEKDSTLNLNKFTLKCDQMYSEIQKICSEVHKLPDQINIVNATPSIYYIEYSGFKSRIEHVLYTKGYVDLLIDWSNEVKKTYRKNKRLFETCLNASIEDIFTIMDYEHDRGTIIFYVK
ncbi:MULTISPECIES: Na-translocating system protein MpsC family protein [Metabacillus]|uniref:Na+-translocating membrane potential-generating system MpsC domain-containing protein n=2 Tax=Metabacillus TaxID=2675233 RepID=A0A179T2S7_9BACI|nr:MULTISPECIES: Na-translocating system protein MpsC family protein [Metabacillus]OAS88327.1 hypothetical protein A6K24_16610 [Metabacillus litoralis]QNF28052.1 DUF2294 family protein [Metabacillus sp. KUDC1714]